MRCHIGIGDISFKSEVSKAKYNSHQPCPLQLCYSKSTMSYGNYYQNNLQ